MFYYTCNKVNPNGWMCRLILVSPQLINEIPFTYLTLYYSFLKDKPKELKPSAFQVHKDCLQQMV